MSHQIKVSISLWILCLITWFVYWHVALMYYFHPYPQCLPLFVFLHELFNKQSKSTKHWITFLSHCKAWQLSVYAQHQWYLSSKMKLLGISMICGGIFWTGTMKGSLPLPCSKNILDTETPVLISNHSNHSISSVSFFGYMTLIVLLI